MTGDVYALASGKGGVGKTTTAVNLGITLRADGHSVALVDADLGMANMATHLDIEHERSIHDVLAGDLPVEEGLTEVAPGFAILPGTRELSGYADADPDRLDGVLATLAEDYDFVLVDTGGGLSYEDVLPLGMADGVILVTTPDDAAVGDTRKTVELIDLVDGKVLGVVVNRTLDSVDPAAIADDLGTRLLVAIPEDRHVTESTLAGRPLESHAPDSPATEAIGRLAAALTGEVTGATTGGTTSTPAGDGAAATDAEAEETSTSASEAVQSTPAGDASGAEATAAASGGSDPSGGADAAETDADTEADAGPDTDAGTDDPEAGDEADGERSDDAGSDEAEVEVDADGMSSERAATGASDDGDTDDGKTDDGEAADSEPTEAEGTDAEGDDTAEDDGSGGLFGWLSRVF